MLILEKKTGKNAGGDSSSDPKIYLHMEMVQNVFTYFHLEIITLDHQSYMATNTVQELGYGYSSIGHLSYPPNANDVYI